MDDLLGSGSSPVSPDENIIPSSSIADNDFPYCQPSTSAQVSGRNKRMRSQIDAGAHRDREATAPRRLESGLSAILCAQRMAGSQDAQPRVQLSAPSPRTHQPVQSPLGAGVALTSAPESQVSMTSAATVVSASSQRERTGTLLPMRGCGPSRQAVVLGKQMPSTVSLASGTAAELGVPSTSTADPALSVSLPSNSRHTSALRQRLRSQVYTGSQRDLVTALPCRQWRPPLNTRHDQGISVTTADPDVPSTSTPESEFSCASPSNRTRTSARIQLLRPQVNPDTQRSSTSVAPRRRGCPPSGTVSVQRMPGAQNGQVLPTSTLSLPDTRRCLECNALVFGYESLNFCCGSGAIRLPSNEFPEELVRLFTSREEDALHFQRYARLYNNLFAFSSLGGTFDAKTEKGIYVFKLHGQIYHNVPNLLPSDGKPKYLQLYFYDGQHETANRSDCFKEIRQDIIDKLMPITQMNPYARFFRSLREITINDETQILINKNTVHDQRVYNAPTSDEVAVIWTENSSSSESGGPHVVVTGRANDTHRIKHYYGCYDPLQYPLLFPYGECGWRQGLLKIPKKNRTGTEITQNDDLVSDMESTEAFIDLEARRASQQTSEGGSHVSPRAYYCYKLQSRPQNMLLRAGRCFQQYIVDMYVKVENTRLDFHRNNQDTLRAELYQGILDTLQAGENCAANVGRRVILPPTYLGGPRDMKKRYLNAMSLVQKYGKPDLFLTMTCNAAWPEITEKLAPGELAQNRPDLVSRIFQAKLISLKKQIMEDRVFGEVAALIYVVEFQKRGLPHAHFLIILKSACKLKTPRDFDRFVRAEIPDVQDAHLRKIVLKHMMHGPCGRLDPTCPCMKTKQGKARCKNQYPKSFASETTSSPDGYPLYKRTNTGESVTIRRHQLDNRWVIPYNPYLLSLYDCHMNVEVCSSIQAVKYLYKYVYKGHDKIVFSVAQRAPDQAVDEIEQYQSARWVSPCEAAWRIFGFKLFEMHPAVFPLQIHLPNMQTLQLHPSENLQNVVASDRRSRTPLTEFFRVNSSGPQKKLLYGDFTEAYRWDVKAKTWEVRKNKITVIGRLAFVSPSEGERFYLRLLLLHVRAPKSFEDLLTYKGHICATFHEAALKRRLLEEDDAVDLCLKEACDVQMPAALRRLFATILTFSQPSEPVQIWNKYYEHLSADFKRKYPNTPSKVVQLTTRAVEQYLEAMGKTLASYGLAYLVDAETQEIRRTRDIADALDAPIPQECIDCRKMLNPGQLFAFTTIMSYIETGRAGSFFVDGPGGTGKTFLYNALYAEIRLMGKIVLPTATSGIAASNIPSGRTAHSRFKIPIDLDKSLSCDVPKQGSLAALLKETSLIIWDEASMARKENVESLDTLLRDLCNPNLIFGGKVVVFGGDFRQILPIVPHRSTKEVVDSSLVSSFLWPSFIRFRLTENIRARADPEFAAFLLSLGNGELQTEDHGYVSLPDTVTRGTVNIDPEPLHEIATLAFPEMMQGNFDSDIFTTRAILTPMNDDVDALNTYLIEEFPGEEVSYKSFDTMLDDNCNIYPSEFINKLCPGGMSPHDLTLKKNSPVILLRNLLPAFGLCNGTRLLCHRFFPNLIECIIAVGQNKGEHVLIPRITLRPPSSNDYPFQFQRKQFPIKLSFAMTINKSQGQTLEQVAVYLPQPCFSPGQLYVALSRSRRAAKVSVVTERDKHGVPLTEVKNIVSSEVLCLAGIK